MTDRSKHGRLGAPESTMKKARNSAVRASTVASTRPIFESKHASKHGKHGSPMTAANFRVFPRLEQAREQARSKHGTNPSEQARFSGGLITPGKRAAGSASDLADKDEKGTEPGRSTT